jgi:hypothetical protein
MIWNSHSYCIQTEVTSKGIISDLGKIKVKGPGQKASANFLAGSGISFTPIENLICSRMQNQRVK